MPLWTAALVAALICRASARRIRRTAGGEPRHAVQSEDKFSQSRTVNLPAVG